MQRKYPFSSAFGPSDTRKNCIESAQKVYEKLLLRTPEKEELNFETIALIAKNDDGSLNEGKVKELIKIFRPDRKGSLSLLEFVKSGECNQCPRFTLMLLFTSASACCDHHFFSPRFAMHNLNCYSCCLQLKWTTYTNHCDCYQLQLQTLDRLTKLLKTYWILFFPSS